MMMMMWVMWMMRNVMVEFDGVGGCDGERVSSVR